MQDRVNGINLVDVVEDLKERTLARLPGEVAKLVYLASTRDYVTGRYHHDGLAFRFNEQLAEVALAVCHREVFDKMAVVSLQELVQGIEIFIQTNRTEPYKVLDTWKNLLPYRVVIPEHCDRVAREYFFSNFRMALAVLEARLARRPRD
jgi:hypothetical protein